jgi:AAA family ATP:ADP antiporter
VVPREERYKAKNFIDTVIYRGGDALAGWLFAGVSAFAAAAVAAAWTALAVFLGVRMRAWTGDDARSSPRLQRQR